MRRNASGSEGGNCPMSNNPILNLPEAERVDYLTVLAMLASVEGGPSQKQTARLEELSKAFKLSEAGRARVKEALNNPPTAVRSILDRLSGSDLRFTLITDLISIAYADEEYSGREEAEIRQIAMILRITDEQVGEIRRYIQAMLEAEKARRPRRERKRLGRELAAGLASVGVPTSAVAVSGSLHSLTAGAIGSALSALGFGFGAAVGAGVALGLGISSYFVVKWLYGKISDDGDGEE